MNAPSRDWNALECIRVRLNLEALVCRIELKSQNAPEGSTREKEAKEFIAVLREAERHSNDLQFEREVAMSSMRSEKMAHAITLQRLSESVNRVNQLEQENANLRASIEKHMSHEQGEIDG